MTFTVTGTVPQHMYDPNKPVYQYLTDEHPIRKGVLLGSNGRTVSVVTDSETVAKQMVSIFESVFDGVHLTAPKKRKVSKK